MLSRHMVKLSVSMLMFANSTKDIGTTFDIHVNKVIRDPRKGRAAGWWDETLRAEFPVNCRSRGSVFPSAEPCEHGMDPIKCVNCMWIKARRWLEDISTCSDAPPSACMLFQEQLHWLFVQTEAGIFSDPYLTDQNNSILLGEEICWSVAKHIWVTGALMNRAVV